ncbi:hypothetical protein EJB05_26066, partial [Eragrostis curvula]
MASSKPSAASSGLAPTVPPGAPSRRSRLRLPVRVDEVREDAGLVGVASGHQDAEAANGVGTNPSARLKFNSTAEFGASVSYQRSRVRSRVNEATTHSDLVGNSSSTQDAATVPAVPVTAAPEVNNQPAPKIEEPEMSEVPVADKIVNACKHCTETYAYRQEAPNPEACYWRHVGHSGKSFLQFFKTSFVRRLTLNEMFSKKFAGEIGTDLKVTLPSGVHYKMRARKDGACYILDSGWDLLAREQCLQNGDFGVFTYNSSAEFSLKLFCRDGTEKSCSFVSKKAPGYYPAANESCVGDLVDFVYGKSARPTHFLRERVAKQVGSNATRTSYPSYVCRLTESSVNRGILGFNKEYTTRCLARLPSKMVFVDANGDRPHSGRIFLLPNGTSRVTSGWKKFVAENGLEIDDLCVFTLSKQGTTSVKATSDNGRGCNFWKWEDEYLRYLVEEAGILPQGPLRLDDA